MSDCPTGVPFGWEVERHVDDLDLPLHDWQRDVILRQWPDPRQEAYMGVRDWVCEDCAADWLLDSDPPDDAECDSCGGRLVSEPCSCNPPVTDGAR